MTAIADAGSDKMRYHTPAPPFAGARNRFIKYYNIHLALKSVKKNVPFAVQNPEKCQFFFAENPANLLLAYGLSPGYVVVTPALRADCNAPPCGHHRTKVVVTPALRADCNKPPIFLFRMPSCRYPRLEGGLQPSGRQERVRWRCRYPRLEGGLQLDGKPINDGPSCRYPRLEGGLQLLETGLEPITSCRYPRLEGGLGVGMGGVRRAYLRR